jgi:hypothetical protein
VTHVIGIREAFVEDARNTFPCTIERLAGAVLPLRTLAGEPLKAVPENPWVLARALGRDDLTRLDGEPLGRINPNYHRLGIAFGPPVAPRRLRVLAVHSFGSDPPSIPRFGEEPGWLLFELVRPREEEEGAGAGRRKRPRGSSRKA